mgnify:CR=1 FL=1
MRKNTLMRKHLKLATIATALILAAGAFMLSTCVKADQNTKDVSEMETLNPTTQNPTYPTCGIVTSVNYDTDTVIVTTAEGNEWAFYEAEDWSVGDVCAMVMDSMDTETIYDDQILECRYAGSYDDLIEMDLHGEWK